MAKPEPTGALRAGIFTLAIGILQLQSTNFHCLSHMVCVFVKEAWEDRRKAEYRTQLSGWGECSGHGTEG